MLTVQRSEIVNSQGNVVRLRGVSIGGWMNLEDFITGHPGAEYSLRHTMHGILGEGRTQFFFDRLLHHFFSEDDVGFIKRSGANVIRVPLNYRHFETDLDPFRYLERGFQRLDKLLAWCERHQLYVILDLHAVQGWQSARWHSDNANNLSLFWSYKHFQDRFVAFWQEVAKRYKDSEAIAAYEVCNEPVTNLPNGQTGQPYVPDWAIMNTIYRQVVDAIRKIDTQHIIVLEGDERGHLFSGLEAPPDSNIIYSSHNYSRFAISAHAYPTVVDGKSWDRGFQERIFLEHEGTKYARKHQVPLLVGEFGLQYNNTPDHVQARLRALRDQIDVYEQHSMHWVLWTYKDLGAMGWVHVNPDERYMRMIQPILNTKRVFRADFAYKYLGVNGTQRMFLGLLREIDKIAAAPARRSVDYTGIMEQTMQNLVGGMHQYTFAKLFEPCTETEIDEILSAFALKNCLVQQDYMDIVRGCMPGSES